MPNQIHANLTGADAVHPAAYVQSTDPGTVGANKQWIDTSVGPPYVLKLRNATNTAWLLFAAGITGPAGATGASGPAGPSGTIAVTGAAPYICIQDRKPQNTQGGTFTSGAWRTRTLNTIRANDVNLASLDTNLNRITLPAGTWRCRISAPGTNCNFHQIRLQNITDAATQLIGTSEYTASAAAQSQSIISDRFALQSSKAFEVQHQCGLTGTFGVAANFTTEVYTIAEFWLEGPAPPFFGSTLPTRLTELYFVPLQRQAFAALGSSQQHSLNTPPQ